MAKTGAERMRAHRRRVAVGRLLIKIEIDDVRVPEMLVAAGLLRPDQTDDPDSLAAALAHLIDQLEVVAVEG